MKQTTEWTAPRVEHILKTHGVWTLVDVLNAEQEHCKELVDQETRRCHKNWSTLLSAERESRKSLVDLLNRLHYNKDGHPIAWPSEEDVQRVLEKGRDE